MNAIRALPMLLLLAATTLSQSGCMEFGSMIKGKPKLAQPLASESEPEPAPPTTTPTPEPAAAPTIDPTPAAPDLEQEAKYKAACTELLRVAKDVDDFAYDRKGRMNEAQIKEFLARCLQSVQAIEREIPRLAP